MDHIAGHDLERHEDPLLHRVLRQDPPVAGVHPGDGRRVVGRQLLVVRQIAPVFLEDVDQRAHAQHHDHQGGGEERCEDSCYAIHVSFPCLDRTGRTLRL